MPKFVMTFEEADKLTERFELKTWKTDKRFSVSDGKVDDTCNGKID